MFEDWSNQITAMRRGYLPANATFSMTVEVFMAKRRKAILSDYYGSPKIVSLIEFNIALNVLKQHGLFVYCDSKGKWRVCECRADVGGMS